MPNVYSITSIWPSWPNARLAFCGYRGNLFVLRIFLTPCTFNHKLEKIKPRFLIVSLCVGIPKRGKHQRLSESVNFDVCLHERLFLTRNELSTVIFTYTIKLSARTSLKEGKETIAKI